MNFLNRFKYSRDSYLITILIVAIALMVNFIASRHFVKVDLTANQLFAISDASKTIVGNLDDIVTVKVFFSEQLPPRLFDVRQYADDILDELASYSKGNLVVDFLNPANPDISNEALQYGIPQIQMNIVEKDKFEVKNGFLGIAVIYGDRLEILPVVQNVSNIEYGLVAAIKKVTAKEARKVGFLTGHDEPSLTQRMEVGEVDDSFFLLKKALDRNYQVLSINLGDDEVTLDDVDTLLIAGSKTAFSDEEKYAIDQFLLGGGSLIVFLDLIDVTNDLQASLLELDINELIEHYGVRIEKQFALDRSNEIASFNQGFSTFFKPYDFWVKAVNQFFDPMSPIVSKLDSIVFPWTSPLKLFEKEGVTTTVLLSSTTNAWLQNEPFNLDPNLVQNLTKKDQYPLVALLEGGFTSFFDRSGEGHFDTSLKTGRILIAGNSRFATDRFIKLYPQNLSFIMNAIDFLTLDESLISIRSKSSVDLPLKNLTDRDRQIVKFLGILLMPILVITFGVVRSFIRRKQKYIL